jgi:hypothetical protein
MGVYDDVMADHQHHREVIDELSPQHRALRQMIPEVYQRFDSSSARVAMIVAIARPVRVAAPDALTREWLQDSQ